MSKRKTLALLIAAVVLHACGEPKETCVCTCSCGSGQESNIEGASSEEECASSCGMFCGADSNMSNYDCRTEGATSETPTGR